MITIDYNNPDQITVEYVLWLDAWDNPPIWLRDDYLCMRGICYSSNRSMYNWLDRLADMKEVVKLAQEYEFRVDKM